MPVLFVCIIKGKKRLHDLKIRYNRNSGIVYLLSVKWGNDTVLSEHRNEGCYGGYWNRSWHNKQSGIGFS